MTTTSTVKINPSLPATPPASTSLEVRGVIDAILEDDMVAGAASVSAVVDGRAGT